MTKYWSKALFYRSRKDIAGIVGAFTAVLIMLKVYPLISYLNILKEEASVNKLGGGWYHWFEKALMVEFEGLIPFVVFGVVALVISLFRHDRLDTTGDLLGSLPFTKKQIIVTKWLTGALVVIVPFLLVFLLLSLFYGTNSYWITTPYSTIPSWTLMNLALALTIFSFLFMVQTLMGHSTYGGIVGAICIVTPGYLLLAGSQVLGKLLYSYQNSIVVAMERLAPKTLIWQVLEPGITSESLFTTPVKYYYYYPNFSLKLVILLAMISLFFWISLKAYQANRLEKNGEILMFGFLEPVLIWGFALCLGLFFPNIFGWSFETNNLLFIIYIILGMALGYFIARGAVAMAKDK